jgi:putative ABC transport system permease protein
VDLRDSIESALRAITANKLRSSLTVLGVVIGVGSVIAMIGIGEGAKRKSIENLEIMGTNMLTVMPNWQRGGQSMGQNSAATLKDEDVADIKKGVPAVAHISGAVRSSRPVKFGPRSTQTQIIGCEPQFAIIRNTLKMHQGGWFDEADNRLQAPKAVLGYQVYDTLFGNENAVGTTIKIAGQNYDVVGVVAYKGGSGMMSPDDQIYVPLENARKRLLGKTNLDYISMQAVRSDILLAVQDQVEKILTAKRKNASGEALFRVMNQGEMLEQVQSQTQLLSLLLAGIASVSLLVGGIGIMNIMLVSVTERTREIGLRKAVGATRETILSQFLLESVVMCVAGGILGIILGNIGVYFVAQAMKVPPAVSLEAIGLAFGFSALIGIFFGLYPALRASSLQPIEALRHE